MKNTNSGLANQPAATTFSVSDVQIAHDGPNTTTVQDAIEEVIVGEVEACSTPEAEAVAPYGFHALFEALHRAYDEHRPLVLSPDDIWLTIAQGLAACVNRDPERYRSAFVSHEGKAQIVIRRDGFVMGDFANEWASCFPEFSERIREYIGDETQSLILSDFTTTGPVEKAASEIVLMDTVQAYFEYEVWTKCGIPSITLLGSPEDWQTVIDKTRGLARFGGMEFWLDEIYPVVDEFAAASRGNIDLDFWQNIYKGEDGSGSMTADGHLLKLVPFLNGSGQKYVNPAFAGGTVDVSELPQALSCVPFIWDYYGERFDYQFLAGHVAIGYDEETGALRPLIGWAVRPAPQSIEVTGR